MITINISIDACDREAADEALEDIRKLISEGSEAGRGIVPCAFKYHFSVDECDD